VHFVVAFRERTARNELMRVEIYVWVAKEAPEIKDFFAMNLCHGSP
jgi:hypothetical protein